ncbi:DUF7674 family protein [Deinococcus ruber]|uniref:DUF7674 domain-containing protein n=1 Tax=Deinococcus ruber TaxID=1848197 RepID=A0A918F3D8_9DEIO|nr:hypothetical protein [Deinococcus ruber]GGR00997.1 hypothetical protein GCM10008957_12350 [Deinococcus ruber]
MALVDRHINDLLQGAKRLFSEIRQEINDHQGLVHIQLSCLAQLSQTLIASKNLTDFQILVELVDQHFEPANERLEKLNNAVYVSFFEYLYLDVENGDLAWAVMPSKLRTEYASFIAALEADGPKKLDYMTNKQKFSQRQKRASRHQK